MSTTRQEATELRAHRAISLASAIHSFALHLNFRWCFALEVTTEGPSPALQHSSDFARSAERYDSVNTRREEPALSLRHVAARRQGVSPLVVNLRLPQLNYNPTVSSFTRSSSTTFGTSSRITLSSRRSLVQDRTILSHSTTRRPASIRRTSSSLASPTSRNGLSSRAGGPVRHLRWASVEAIRAPVELEEGDDHHLRLEELRA